jgi:hypothetical protein
MSNRFLRKALRLVLPSKTEVAMNTLFGRQTLGWTKLPKKPGFINGSIFQKQSISLPWFTYPAIAQLLRWNLKDLVVIEYGSGSSTKFFYEQGCKLVVSREDNQEWFKFIRSSIPFSDRIEYKLAEEKNNYVISSAELSDIKPSIILIDGSHRADCARMCLDWIKSISPQESPALIILDNSDWYGKSYSMLASLEEYIPIDFYGYGPYNQYAWCTTLFVNSKSSSAASLFSGSQKSATPTLNGLQQNYSSDK